MKVMCQRYDARVTEAARRKAARGGWFWKIYLTARPIEGPCVVAPYDGPFLRGSLRQKIPCCVHAFMHKAAVSRWRSEHRYYPCVAVRVQGLVLEAGVWDVDSSVKTVILYNAEVHPDDWKTLARKTHIGAALA